MIYSQVCDILEQASCRADHRVSGSLFIDKLPVSFKIVGKIFHQCVETEKKAYIF